MNPRTCVGCRARDDARDLVRVVAVNGVAVVDASRRLPGRGAHIHPGPTCLALALRRRALPRALRADPLRVDDLSAAPIFA